MAPAIGVHFGGCLDTFLGAHCFLFVCLRSRSVWLMFSYGNCIAIRVFSFSCFPFFSLVCVGPLSSFRIRAAVRCYLFWAPAKDQERLRCESGQESCSWARLDSVQRINIERIDVDVAPAVAHTLANKGPLSFCLCLCLCAKERGMLCR